MNTPSQDYLSWHDYAKDIATHHVSIRHTDADPHFAMMYLEEVLTKTSLDFKDVCLIAEFPDMNYFNQDNHDNNFLLLTGGILIVKHFEQGDFRDYLTKASECLVIAKDISKKIFKDYAACRDDEDADPNLNYLQTNGMKFQKVGPLFGNWVGTRMVPVIGNPEDINNYDSEKWTY